MPDAADLLRDTLPAEYVHQAGTVMMTLPELSVTVGLLHFARDHTPVEDPRYAALDGACTKMTAVFCQTADEIRARGAAVPGDPHADGA